MIEMSYSEKVARVFEIVSYFMLIPAGFALIFSLYIWLYAFAILISGGNVIGIIILAVVNIPPVAGFWLLAQYRKHSRGRLDKNRIQVMWIVSILFNAIFAVFGSYIFILQLSMEKSFELSIGFAIGFIMSAWWIIATILPFTALVSLDFGKHSDSILEEN